MGMRVHFNSSTSTLDLLLMVVGEDDARDDEEAAEDAHKGEPLAQEERCEDDSDDGHEVESDSRFHDSESLTGTIPKDEAGRGGECAQKDEV